MRNNYERAQIEVLEFNLNDVIATSTPGGTGTGNQTPILSGSADKGAMTDSFI